MADEVHHIVPISEGGKNILENAAPLCVKCHELFGHQKSRRKKIRESRKYWFEYVEKKYSSESIDIIQKIYEELIQIKNNQKNHSIVLIKMSEIIDEFKKNLENVLKINKIQIESIPDIFNIYLNADTIIRTHNLINKKSKL
jgi:predicted HNH restriction endonuclease